MIALPALEAMFTSRGLVIPSANAAPAAVAKRLVTFFIPNGVPTYVPDGGTDQHLWFPATTGSGYTMPLCLEPIAAYRDRFNILNGVVLGESCADGHAGGTTGFSTGLAPTTTGAAGPSVDQVAAAELGDTAFRTLGVGVKPIDVQFNDFNIACFDEISWIGPNQVAPLRRDPAQLFDDLFAGGVPVDPAQAERKKAQRLSVLDFVQDDIGRLKSRLGKSDNLRLDAHLSAVRELEMRVEGASALSCQVPPEPVDPAGYVEKAKLQAELLAMALRCDLTRFGAFMYGHGGNDGGGKDEAHGIVEVNGEYPQQHNFTHWLTERPDWYDALFASLTQFTLTHMEVFAHFLDALKGEETGPDDFLSDTLIYMGSELGDGTNHDNNGNVLPILIVGNGGGALKTGSHVKLASNVRVADVLFTLLRMVGSTAPSFAGASQEIALG
ncbi:MAG: DUF1552 domain-containing protein [Myxococcales bacterium]|nr:DUF1552 domain-containing protein [Myxococcales bacterium]